MPHKRQTRAIVNPKNSGVRRLHCTPSARPYVIVESANGLDAEFPPPPVSVQPKRSTTTTRPMVPQLAAPEYNTSVRQKGEIETIKNMQAAVSLSPKTMAAIAPTITQKMNFKPSDTVFKNLESLNVNDSVMVPHKKSSRAKEAANSKAKQELKLADYLENIRLIDMVIPEPEINLEFERKRFDYFGVYKQMYYD